ncbi:hypothetical protein L1987_53432 [Smallanthus sonchifolius]|uniref:Uncharacterized protein n=1 Tax=Smallanthus sonchifolius TaxID=185202 RepID=A0ACB9EX43_9ASTR|nr:hypothetical protein L1987_53432 [Smallanthus sonchifolius]
MHLSIHHSPLLSFNAMKFPSMSVLLLFVIFVVSSAMDTSIAGYHDASSSSDDEVNTMYLSWMVKHGKVYNTLTEKNLSTQEYRLLYTGAKKIKSKLKFNNDVHSSDILPDFVDWRTIGSVAAIKDQGYCGTSEMAIGFSDDQLLTLATDRMIRPQAILIFFVIVRVPLPPLILMIDNRPLASIEWIFNTALISVVGYNDIHMTITDASSSSWRTDDEVNAMYLSWLVKHGKVYNAIRDIANRFHIFKDNLRYIEQHNSRHSSYKLRLNKFADLTAQEYQLLYTGAKKIGSKVQQRQE